MEKNVSVRLKVYFSYYYFSCRVTGIKFTEKWQTHGQYKSIA